MRQACEARLRTLEVPDPFSINAFCDALARERDRPIRLVPMPDGGDAPCGVWLSTADTDWVFHQVATSPLHQEHIILHELAHMIFDHKTVRDQAEGLQAQLLPDLDPRVIATVLGRMPYSSEQEQEAEMLAGLIGSHAKRPARPSADSSYARAVDVFRPGT